MQWVFEELMFLDETEISSSKMYYNVENACLNDKAKMRLKLTFMFNFSDKIIQLYLVISQPIIKLGEFSQINSIFRIFESQSRKSNLIQFNI